MTSQLETRIPNEEAAVTAWVTRFDLAMRDGDAAQLANLFVDDAHWRDLVALSWTIRTTNGRDAVVADLLAARDEARPASFRLSPTLSAPRQVTRGEEQVIEGFLEFSTAAGTGGAVVRLDPSTAMSDQPRAIGLLTSLERLSTETPPPVFTPDFVFERHDTRVDWAEEKARKLQYLDREPEILVVGGGHGGLMIAARLRALGHEVLIVERLPRIGDNWRTRYDSLMLHTLTAISAFPYITFPETLPQFLSKDQYAYWLESYAENLELDVWTSSELLAAVRDEDAGTWSATVRREDGTERVLHPQHVVMATGGFGAIPNKPKLPGLDTFAGSITHSSEFTSGEPFRGQSVLVVGAGVSAHDIIYDLHGRGCKVAMLQRGSVTVTSLYTAHLPFYDVIDPPLKPEDAPLVGAADFHQRWTDPMLIRTTRRGREHDRDLLDGLEKAGMSIDFGPNDLGYLFKAFHYAGGYYIDVGCSQLIADGEVPVVQYDTIDSFNPEGLRLQDGTEIALDAVILATGFLNPQHQVETVFGQDVSDSVGEVFRLTTESGEFVNSWVPTAQPGLWFMNGGIAQSTPMSRYLAINISARLSGLKPE